MAGREAVRKAVQQVRPILSVDREEARKRALNLYKAWYRQIPYIGKSVEFVKRFVMSSAAPSVLMGYAYSHRH